MGHRVIPPRPRRENESAEAYRHYLDTEFRPYLERMANEQGRMFNSTLPLAIAAIIAVVFATLMM